MSEEMRCLRQTLRGCESFGSAKAALTQKGFKCKTPRRGVNVFHLTVDGMPCQLVELAERAIYCPQGKCLDAYGVVGATLLTRLGREIKTLGVLEKSAWETMLDVQCMHQLQAASYAVVIFKMAEEASAEASLHAPR